MLTIVLYNEYNFQYIYNSFLYGFLLLHKLLIKYSIISHENENSIIVQPIQRHSCNKNRKKILFEEQITPLIHLMQRMCRRIIKFPSA